MLTVSSLDVTYRSFIGAYKTRTPKTFVVDSFQMTSSTLIWGLERELRCQMNYLINKGSLRAGYDFKASMLDD